MNKTRLFIDALDIFFYYFFNIKGGVCTLFKDQNYKNVISRMQKLLNLAHLAAAACGPGPLIHLLNNGSCLYFGCTVLPRAAT